MSEGTRLSNGSRCNYTSGHQSQTDACIQTSEWQPAETTASPTGTVSSQPVPLEAGPLTRFLSHGIRRLPTERHAGQADGQASLGVFRI